MRAVAGNDNRPAAAPPRARDVFFAWLLWLPDDVDPHAAARAEIARIDRRAGARGREVASLRALFVELVAASEGPRAPSRAEAGRLAASPMDRSPPRP